MPKTISIQISPEEAHSSEAILSIVSKELSVNKSNINHISIDRRSIDARKKNIKVLLRLDVYINEEYINTEIIRNYQDVSNKDEVIIIGSGPAGLFAALKLIELGLKPIILERGKNVRDRRRDIAAINKKHLVNNDSNYCFGEGGAGTYSDGKLYTRSKKRGSILNVLETLVFHGAKKDILIDAHPHIGTNKLPKIIANIRETILKCGGEVHFNTKVVDLIIKNNSILGVTTQTGDKIIAKNTILATGHSARDIFELLHQRSIQIEYKPFAMGIRIEHPQTIIDKIQYSKNDRGPYLPPASYRLVEQVNGRGVYSFCMCPGGFIVPAATNAGEIVVNGMSPSKRNSEFANSGIVVEVKEEDLSKYNMHGPLKGLMYQKDVEKLACSLTPSLQVAPAQRMVDFVNKKASLSLNKTSYQPGILSTNMHDILPKSIYQSLSEGFKMFGKKLNGYYTNQANVVGIESRTSSPVFIPRDKDTLQHLSIKNLFPCGEGAGYAGGIISAAIDGERCAQAILQ